MSSVSGHRVASRYSVQENNQTGQHQSQPTQRPRQCKTSELMYLDHLTIKRYFQRARWLIIKLQQDKHFRRQVKLYNKLPRRSVTRVNKLPRQSVTLLNKYPRQSDTFLNKFPRWWLRRWTSAWDRRCWDRHC